MYIKNVKHLIGTRPKLWIRIIPVMLTATVFLLGGCQSPPSQRSDASGQNSNTGQALPSSSPGLTVTKSEDGQNTAHISGTVEGKIALVSVDAKVSLPDEDTFPIYTALPLDINQDIDQTAWLALAFGDEVQKAEDNGISKLNFSYEIPDLKFIGYNMSSSSFLFTASDSLLSIVSAEDLHEIQGTPPDCSFAQEEAITKATEILSQYGIGEGFSPLSATAMAYNRDTQGYYAVEFERSIFNLPIFRHTLIDKNTGESLKGDTLSVFVSDQGIIRISGTIHKYTELKERQPIITLEQALDIFEKNIDFVNVGLGETGEKTLQKVAHVQLIYMPVPDPEAQSSDSKGAVEYSSDQEQSEDVKPITMVPAWYFSTASDDKEKSLSITAESSQYRMFINAVTGELIR